MSRRSAHRIGVALLLGLALSQTACPGMWRRQERREDRRDDRQDRREDRRDDRGDRREERRDDRSERWE
jgi:hypothetical protein